MCVKDIESWMAWNKLNQEKTEFLIASSPHQYRLLEHVVLRLDKGITIHPLPSVRNLGVTFDRYMNMDDHVTKLSRSVNYHIRSLSHIH